MGQLDFDTLMDGIHKDNRRTVMIEDKIKIDEHMAEEQKEKNEKDNIILFPGVQACHISIAAAKNYMKGVTLESK